MINENNLHIARCDLYEKYGEEGLRNVHGNYQDYPHTNESLRNIPEITEEEALKLIKTTFKGDISDELFKDLYVTYKVYGTSEFYRKVEKILNKGEPNE